MANCPVCDTEYVEGQVDDCTTCGWDLIPYPPTLGPVPEAFLQKERQKIAWAKKKWTELQSQQRWARSPDQPQLDRLQLQLEQADREQRQLQSQLKACEDQQMGLQFQVEQLNQDRSDLQTHAEQLRSELELSQSKCSQLQLELKQANEQAWQQASDSQREEQEKRTGPVEILRLRLRVGKGSEFLRGFYNAINQIEPHIINTNLITTRNSEGLRILIDKLKSGKRGWVKLNDKKCWEVTAKHYEALTDWLLDEIHRQSQKEKMEEDAENKINEDLHNRQARSPYLSFADFLTEIQNAVYDVEIRIPLNTNSN